MPKEISHIFFAEEIKKVIDTDLQKILDNYLSLYYYGSTVPDLYYYYLPNKKFDHIAKLDWGLQIHDNRNNLLPIYNLLKYAKEIKTNKKFSILSFVCGYLTHVAADTIFHPYIYSITGHYYNPDEKKKKISQRNHRIFETCMDLFIINNIYKKNLKDLQLNQKIFLKKQEEMDILFLFAIILKQSFFPNIEIRDDEFILLTKYCYNNHKKLFNIFQKEKLINFLLNFKKFSFTLNFLLSLCYGNHKELKEFDFLKFEEVPHPVTGHTIKGNFFDFTKKIIERGILFLNTSYQFVCGEIDYITLTEKIPHYSLNTGMIQISNEKMDFFKLHPAFNPI